MVEIQTRTYKGKEYKIYGICIKSKEIYPKGQWVYIAKESLSEIFNPDEIEKNELADELDMEIYHYVKDEVIDKGDWEDIAKNHLDEEFELIDEVE